MKHSKLSLALILIVLALLLSVVRNASADSKSHRALQHQAKTEPHANSVEQKEPQVPFAISQSTISALRESIADNKQQAIAAQKQAEASKETFCSPAVVVNEVLALVGLCYLYLMYLQWKAIDEQAKIAKDTLTQTSRPWVSAEISIVSDLVYDVNGAHITFQVVMKNTGHSVAKAVWPDLKLLLRIPKMKGGPIDEVAEQQKLSEEARKRNPAKFKLGFVIFPNAIAVINMTLGLFHSEIENAKLGERDNILPCLIGCVDYCFTFGPPDEHHQTGFIYDLLNKQPYMPGMFAIQAGVEVPADQLQLGLSVQGGSYAD